MKALISKFLPRGFKSLDTSLIAIAFLAILSAASVIQAQDMKPPQAVVKETVDTMVTNIQANRADYTSNNTALYEMVNKVLVPTIHIERMSNLILGRENSSLATPAQKKAFAAEFKTFLMRSYATALLEYTGNEKVVYEAVVVKPGADKVTVKAKLVASDGQSYPVNLYMSNRRDTQWRAYNIEVAGINFVATYRSTFGDIVERKGIDGLITELRSKNEKLAS